MYIYFPQEGTIFCYSTKNVPNVGEASQICPSASTISANTQWQLVSDGTLQLRGDQTITRGVPKLNGWSMVTTSTTTQGWHTLDQTSQNQCESHPLDRDGRIALYPGRVISPALRPL